MSYSSLTFYYRFSPVALLAGLLCACGKPTVEPAGPVTWGAADNVVRSGNLYFSAQPDQAGLEAARAAGVGMVIDLRAPGERDWDEAAAARDLGLQYFNLPVPRSGPGFDSDTIDSLHKLVAANEDQQILLHCSTGNRASAWYALYLVERKNLPLEDALSLAARTGLDREDMVARVREYLSAR